MTVSRTTREQESTFKSITRIDVPQKLWPQWNVGRIRIFGIFVHFKFFAVLLTELCVITAAIYYSYFQATLLQPQVAGWLLAKSVVAAGPFILCFAGLGLYSSRQTLSGSGVLFRYLVASVIAFASLWIFYELVQAHVRATEFLAPVVLSILFLAAVRFAFGRLLDSNFLKKRVLVVGSGQKASYVERIASEPDQRGFSLVNVRPDLNVPRALSKAVKNNRISEVVVAFDDRRNTLPAAELLDCRLSGVSVVDVLDFLERETGVIPFEHLQPSWLIFTDGFASNALSKAVKRIFDIFTAGILILLTLPISLISSLAIKMDTKSPGPILYKQVRVGLDGQQFKVLKFRSMRTDAEIHGEAKWASQNDPRVSAVGGLLRKYRIDELPQLFNVLMGSMSLVGPRPERPIFVQALCEKNDLYNERHRVKPGVTGWAQLRYPYTDNEEDSIKKLQYDMYYLKNQGFIFDLYILLQTIEVVLFSKGSR